MFCSAVSCPLDDVDICNSIRFILRSAFVFLIQIYAKRGSSTLDDRTLQPLSARLPAPSVTPWHTIRNSNDLPSPRLCFACTRYRWISILQDSLRPSRTCKDRILDSDHEFRGMIRRALGTHPRSTSFTYCIIETNCTRVRTSFVISTVMERSLNESVKSQGRRCIVGMRERESGIQNIRRAAYSTEKCPWRCNPGMHGEQARRRRRGAEVTTAWRQQNERSNTNSISTTADHRHHHGVNPP